MASARLVFFPPFSSPSYFVALTGIGKEISCEILSHKVVKLFYDLAQASDLIGAGLLSSFFLALKKFMTVM